MAEAASVRFRGKIAPWWYATVVVVIAVTIWLAVVAALSLADGFTAGAAVSLCGAVIFCAFDVFLVDSCRRNHIDLSDACLKVRMSFFSLTVAYPEISLVQETNNPLASLSTSLDRLLIRFRRYDEVLVSVKDKEEFLAALMARCPQARLVRK